MTSLRGWGSVAMLVAGIAFPVVAQQRPLNPTVVVREHPTSAVPPECEQGLAPAVPRAAQPVPEPAPLPETSAQIANQDVAQALREVQTAAETNDHERFVAALAVARVAAEAAPPGGQRDVANDALKVESDIDRLWSFSLDSPTGAFFDASSEGGALLTMLRQYPDYGKAVADATLLVGDQTLYPTRESRQFLIRQAATRLARLGIHTVARTPPPPRRQPMPERASVPAPSPEPVPAAPVKSPVHGTTSTARSATRSTPRTTSRSTTAPAPRRHEVSTTTPRVHTSTKPAKPSTKLSTKPATSATQRAAVAPVVKTPAPQPQPVAPKKSAVVAPVPLPAVTATHAAPPAPARSTSTATATMPAPAAKVATTPAATASLPTTSMNPPPAPLTTTTAPVASTTSTTSTTATTSTVASSSTVSIPPSVPASTASTDATATSDTASTAASDTAAPHPAEGGSGQMNLMFAIILILLGVGLLWFFIRSSE